jgi:hypothetical protein
MAKTTNKDRRQQRAKAFAAQKINQASDFNVDKYNRKDVEGTHISGQEARTMSQMNSKENGGKGLRDTYQHLMQQKESGATFGKRAESKLTRMGARIDKLDARKAAKEKAKASQGSTGQPTNPIDETVTGGSDNVPDNEQLNHFAVMPHGHNAAVDNNVDNSQHQEVNQDNDQSSTINGDNNKVFQNQDNSVRNYGGDNRSFVYNSAGGGGDGGMYDSPVSAATMGGFYDVDDSPAAQAKFQDMYNDFNKDNSARFAGQALETVGMFGTDMRGYTPEAMGNTIGKSTQYSFDRADRQTGQVFGDIWNDNYITENWKMPTPPKEIESNAGELADEAKEDIDDL